MFHLLVQGAKNFFWGGGGGFLLDSYASIPKTDILGIKLMLEKLNNLIILTPVHFLGSLQMIHPTKHLFFPVIVSKY